MIPVKNSGVSITIISYNTFFQWSVDKFHFHLNAAEISIHQLLITTDSLSWLYVILQNFNTVIGPYYAAARQDLPCQHPTGIPPVQGPAAPFAIQLCSCTEESSTWPRSSSPPRWDVEAAPGFRRNQWPLDRSLSLPFFLFLFSPLPSIHNSHKNTQKKQSTYKDNSSQAECVKCNARKKRTITEWEPASSTSYSFQSPRQVVGKYDFTGRDPGYPDQEDFLCTHMNTHMEEIYSCVWDTRICMKKTSSCVLVNSQLVPVIYSRSGLHNMNIPTIADSKTKLPVNTAGTHEAGGVGSST